MDILKVKDNVLHQKVFEWLEWDKNEKTSNEIQCLVKEGELEKLRGLMLKRIEFGTAGLRGRMGAGYSQMNDLVVIQTSQGLANYLLQQESFDAKEGGVVIGYDGRHNSRRFAELSAGVFLNCGIPVYLFSEVCPAELVAFAVQIVKCVAGIMITAPNNSKDDNGYEVYWSNGEQIISPHDEGIKKSIDENLCPWETSWDTSIIKHSSLLKDPLTHIMRKHIDHLKDQGLFPNVDANTSIEFIYTEMRVVKKPHQSKSCEAAAYKGMMDIEDQIYSDIQEFLRSTLQNPKGKRQGKAKVTSSFSPHSKVNVWEICANYMRSFFKKLSLKNPLSNRKS